MRKYKALNQATMTPGASFDTEHSNLAYDAMMWKYSATISGTATGVAEDAAYRMMGTPEIQQAEEPIVRIEGRTLRHLAAFTAGGYGRTIAGTTGAVLAGAYLDFGKIMPGSFITGSVKSFVRGQVEPLASYGGGLTALAGNLRNAVATLEAPPGVQHLRPFYREFSIGIPANDPAQQHLITIDQDLVTAGLFVVVRDADAIANGGGRVDTLVRAIRVDVTRGARGQEEHMRFSWGQLRELTARLAGFTDLDWIEATGTAFIPFSDPEDPRFSGRMALTRGDTIVLTIDSNATLEEEFGTTGATAASGDAIRVVRLDHQVVAGGQGLDVGAPLSSRRALQISPGAASRNGRRRRPRRVR